MPGHKDSCLTCVALVDEEDSKSGVTSRLFSGGLDGALLEWDVEHLRTHAAADSLGGAVWQLAPEPGACIKLGAVADCILRQQSCHSFSPCLLACLHMQNHATVCNGYAVHMTHFVAGICAADSPARIAAACDDGCARIFQAEAGVPGLSYVKTLPRVEGRTLAVAWHPSGDVLATAGTDGCIHLWSISGGRELLRITAGDGSGRGNETCIWAVLVLPDGTIVR